jgi:hypothetical protein
VSISLKIEILLVMIVKKDLKNQKMFLMSQVDKVLTIQPMQKIMEKPIRATLRQKKLEKKYGKNYYKDARRLINPARVFFLVTFYAPRIPIFVQP